MHHAGEDVEIKAEQEDANTDGLDAVIRGDDPALRSGSLQAEDRQVASPAASGLWAALQNSRMSTRAAGPAGSSCRFRVMSCQSSDLIFIFITVRINPALFNVTIL